jgi:hypothetical protein
MAETPTVPCTAAYNCNGLNRGLLALDEASNFFTCDRRASQCGNIAFHKVVLIIREFRALPTPLFAIRTSASTVISSSDELTSKIILCR